MTVRSTTRRPSAVQDASWRSFSGSLARLSLPATGWASGTRRGRLGVTEAGTARPTANNARKCYEKGAMTGPSVSSLAVRSFSFEVRGVSARVDLFVDGTGTVTFSDEPLVFFSSLEKLADLYGLSRDALAAAATGTTR